MGVDRLTLRSVRDAGELLDEAGRVTARDELEALIALTLSPSQDRDQLLLQRAGPCWPDGFRLETGARDKLRSTCPAGKEATEVVSHAGIPGLHLACYGQASCQLCGNLRDCPVSRLDFTVPLQPLLLEGAGILHTDLEDSDLGLGRADRAAERRPCLAGWESAKSNSSGDLFICPSCGVEPVGNVLADTLAGIWYSRGLNEFRRMSVGASLALPYIDRNRCAMGCCRRGRDLGLVTRIRSLAKEQLTALEGVGAGDRR